MTALDAIRATFDRDGVAMVEYALASADLNRMDRAFVEGSTDASHNSPPGEFPAWLAAHPVLDCLSAALLGDRGSRLVRVAAQGSQPSANWFAPWQQDYGFAASGNHHHAAGKQGAPLDGTLSLRIHLDDCDERAGPLEVIPGSHRAGRLDRAGIEQLAATSASKLCLARRGDILALRPLTIHRAQRAIEPGPRRVLALDYAIAPLSSTLTSVM